MHSGVKYDNIFFLLGGSKLFIHILMLFVKYFQYFNQLCVFIHRTGELAYLN